MGSPCRSIENSEPTALSAVGSATAVGGRVPPHNLQAEESVLGALLLSRDAIGAVGEAGLQVR